jgi:hypothetical protein
MHLAFRGFIDNNVMNKGRIKYSFWCTHIYKQKIEIKSDY